MFCYHHIVHLPYFATLYRIPSLPIRPKPASPSKVIVQREWDGYYEKDTTISPDSAVKMFIGAGSEGKS